jgi:hypothetical protein
MKLALLTLLLLAGCAMAASCIEDATFQVFARQGTLIAAVVGLNTVLLAISYMLGQALRKPEWIIFAKDEAWHLGFSLVLLLAFSGIVAFSCEFMDFFFVSFFEESGLFGADGGDSQCYTSGRGMHMVATCYAEMAQNDADRLSRAYIQGYIDYLMDSTFSWSFQLPLVNGLTTTAGAYKRIISNQYDIILNSFLVPALMSVSMQKIALDFITENAIKWILPIGFLLRIFIPTRQMGNIIIALSLGIYIVIPFMYVFNFAMYESVFTNEDCLEFADAVCDNVFDSNCSPASTTCGNYNGFWQVARLLPLAFFLPNLTIAIFVTFLSAVNKALKVIG